MTAIDPTDPVPIASFFDPMEARLALAALEGSGIEAGGVRILVRAEDAERAISVLQLSDDDAPICSQGQRFGSDFS